MLRRGRNCPVDQHIQHIPYGGVLGIKLYTISWNLRLIASVLFINLTALVCTIIVPVYRIMKMNPAVTLEDME